MEEELESHLNYLHSELIPPRKNILTKGTSVHGDREEFGCDSFSSSSLYKLYFIFVPFLSISVSNGMGYSLPIEKS